MPYSIIYMIYHKYFAVLPYNLTEMVSHMQQNVAVVHQVTEFSTLHVVLKLDSLYKKLSFTI